MARRKTETKYLRDEFVHYILFADGKFVDRPKYFKSIEDFKNLCTVNAAVYVDEYDPEVVSLVVHPENEDIAQIIAAAKKNVKAKLGNIEMYSVRCMSEENFLKMLVARHEYENLNPSQKQAADALRPDLAQRAR